MYSFATSAAPAADQFTIALGDTVSDGNPGPGAGNLEVPGSLDVYAFAASGGERITLVGSDCAVNASYSLAAPSGRLVARAAVCGTNNVIDLPTDGGNYEVRVSAETSGTGTYALQIATSTDPATVAVPVADVYAVAPGTVVANGAPAAGAGNIEVAGARDIYVFDGSAGKTIVFDDKTTGGCSGLVWSVYAPDGSPLAVDQPLGCPTSRTMRLNQTGRYNVDVHGSADVSGTYSFAVRVAPAVQKFSSALRRDGEPGSPGRGGGKHRGAGRGRRVHRRGNARSVDRAVRRDTRRVCPDLSSAHLDRRPPEQLNPTRLRRTTVGRRGSLGNVHGGRHRGSGPHRHVLIAGQRVARGGDRAHRRQARRCGSAQLDRTERQRRLTDHERAGCRLQRERRQAGRSSRRVGAHGRFGNPVVHVYRPDQWDSISLPRAGAERERPGRTERQLGGDRTGREHSPEHPVHPHRRSALRCDPATPEAERPNELAPVHEIARERADVLSVTGDVHHRPIFTPHERRDAPRGEEPR